MSNVSKLDLTSKQNLFSKYDVPAPRYTSYPTVPYWNNPPDTHQWLTSLNQAFGPPEKSTSWSLYLHIPFCETLCTFCGCNTVITRNHSVAKGYIESILQEWNTYKTHVPKLINSPLRNLHLGGGTPNFLSSHELTTLLTALFKDTRVSTSDWGLSKPDGFEGSVEMDPRRAFEEQLFVLSEFGFRRLSLGVQDFNPQVQKLINRMQSFELTSRAVQCARKLKFSSINFDLIYGLPSQDLKGMAHTMQRTLDLMPDRIALYSLALVPWLKPAQRLLQEKDLPTAEIKRELYEFCRDQLISHGYIEIGMDHFALTHDGLVSAMNRQKLHRNFMGYSDIRTEVLLGLGVSAISETPDCFHQNEKTLAPYQRRVEAGQIPNLRGHLLTDQDRLCRAQLLQFMTQFRVQLVDEEQVSQAHEFLSDLLTDNLVEIKNSWLILTDKGRPFLRHACMALDQRMRHQRPTDKLFSQTV